MSHDILDWTPAHKFNLSGAQLSVMSQAVAYQGIQEGTQPTQRKYTVINLDITRHAVKRVTGWCNNMVLNKEQRYYKNNKGLPLEGAA
jgi:hypothetical protein